MGWIISVPTGSSFSSNGEVQSEFNTRFGESKWSICEKSADLFICFGLFLDLQYGFTIAISLSPNTAFSPSASMAMNFTTKTETKNSAM